ncbi:DUF2721 domain-containing protein [Vallitalea okinawensis]|uniref:DUF2721 domain-containing protein n=1 Tax=Vallitalea okinawensis TaxID=2078660 RepID=UPI000CFB5C05|nr:DUF2721 domain-containing protein [Vallitalea okinawensis]
MNDFSLSIPALLFPALSLLMIAYTNRFVALANIVRALHKEHEENPSKRVAGQIKNLRKRLIYIRNMQAFAISGFFANIVSMFLIVIGFQLIAFYLFALSLILLAVSLVICFMEIYFSVGALNMQLCQDEEELCSDCKVNEANRKAI